MARPVRRAAEESIRCRRRKRRGRCHCGNGPGAAAGPGGGAAAGPGAGSPLAGARRTAMQPARRCGAPRRKSGVCNCCGSLWRHDCPHCSHNEATMRPSELGAARCGPRPRRRRRRRTAGPCPALCKVMTAQLWPTRPAERALLELEDIAGPLPLQPPWKRDAENKQDCQDQSAGLARAANC